MCVQEQEEHEKAFPGGMGGMPGMSGMGGGAGMPDLGGLFSDPDIMAAFQVSLSTSLKNNFENHDHNSVLL